MKNFFNRLGRWYQHFFTKTPLGTAMMTTLFFSEVNACILNWLLGVGFAYLFVCSIAERVVAEQLRKQNEKKD